MSHRPHTHRMLRVGEPFFRSEGINGEQLKREPTARVGVISIVASRVVSAMNSYNIQEIRVSERCV